MAKKATQQGPSAKARQTAATRRSGPSARSRASSPSPSQANATRTANAARGTKAPVKRRVPSPLRALRWWLLPAGVLAVLALFVLAYYPVARVQYQAVRERAQLQAELDSVKARNARLKTQVASLETTEGIEAEARTQLGMVKKGESLGIVIDGDEKRRTDEAPRIDSDVATSAPVGPWTAFLDAVFGVSK